MLYYIKIYLYDILIYLSAGGFGVRGPFKREE